VFLSQNLPGVRDSAGRSDGLFMFQYPLRPKWRPLDLGWKLDKVAYRPLNEMVELELLAGEEGDEFRHKLVSSKVEPKTSFAVGLLRGEQLHLTPLQSLLQFRPRFDWKDEEDAASKRASSTGGGSAAVAKAGADDVAMEEAGSGSDGENAAAAPVVQVKVSKRESDKAQQIRRSSHAYLREQEDKEAWLNVELHGPDDDESKEMLESMVSASGRDINFNVTCSEYLAQLDATCSDGAAAAQVLMAMAPQATGQLSREQLIRMSLSDQVRSLMVAAQVLPLERLEELTPTPSGALMSAAQRRQQMMEELPRQAVMVQGVWVVKSELMYKDDPKNQLQVAHTYTHTHTHLHIHTHKRTHTHTLSLSCTYRCARTHMQVRAHTHTRARAHTHTYNTHTRTHTKKRTHAHTYIHTHAQTHTHTHTHIRTHTNTQTHTHMRTHTHAHTRTHTNTHTR